MIHGTFLEDTNYTEVIERYYREHDHPDFPITHTGLSLIRDFLKERGSARRPEELATAFGLTWTHVDGWEKCTDDDVRELLPVLQKSWRSAREPSPTGKWMDPFAQVFEPEWFFKVFLDQAGRVCPKLNWDAQTSGRNIDIYAIRSNNDKLEFAFNFFGSFTGDARLAATASISIDDTLCWDVALNRIMLLPRYRVAPVDEKATEEAVATLAREVTELCRCMLEIDLKVDRRSNT